MWTTMSSGNPIYHERHLSGRVQCSHRATTALWTTMSSGNPIYHERHLSGRVQCIHRTTAVSNVVTGPLPAISIKRPGNPIYELLYEFKLHCQLLGNLSHHFDNNGFRSREIVNIKQYIIIVEYGDQPDICLWKIRNYLAILTLIEPSTNSVSPLKIAVGNRLVHAIHKNCIVYFFCNRL